MLQTVALEHISNPVCKPAYLDAICEHHQATGLHNPRHLGRGLCRRADQVNHTSTGLGQSEPRVGWTTAILSKL